MAVSVSPRADRSRASGAVADRGPPIEPALLDIDQVSELGVGSTRHIRRMADSGRMPAPVKLGALLRWRVETGDPMTGIRDWIQAGCPSCRQTRGAK
jgi:predicted DNA-binding transcriptional regulator AlpA